MVLENDMDSMFVYSWSVDESQDYTQIRCYGIDSNGKTVALIIPDFTPYVYIELPRTIDWVKVKNMLLNDLSNKTILTRLVDKEHLYNDKGTGKFIFCQCASRRYIGYITFMLRQQTYCGHRLNVHEDMASSVLQLTSLRNIPPATWISFSGGTNIAIDNRQTTCDREIRVSWKSMCPNTDSVKSQVHPKVLAFDLEVNSDFMNSMPMNRPNDVVFQISCVIENPDRTKRKILLTFESDDLHDPMLDGIEVRSYENEEELLSGFISLVRDERPNVMTGYNILMFDISYLIMRCERYGMLEELQLIGFNRIFPANKRTIKWSSSAYKNQEYTFIDWEGILLLDLLPLIKRDYKFENYKLDTVASELIGAEKDPVTYKEIFSSFRTGKMARVGKYCVQDSNLCIDLLNHIHCWVSLSEMSAVCKVPMFALYTQGQQLKIYSQVYDYCLRKNIVVTSNGYECRPGERYLGAYVMDPVPGFYENIVPLDFASLYPSIIIAYNICYSTYVSERDALKIPASDYQTFEWEDHLGCEHDPKIVEITKITGKIEAIDVKISREVEKRNLAKGAVAKREIQNRINALRLQQKPLREKRVELKKSKPGTREDGDGNIVSGIVCASRSYRFLKREIKQGVVPTIIQNLLDSRKQTRTVMKTCEDAADRIVYDKKQLAYKVSANSMYGAMGVRRGMLPFMPGAMCVTYIGRESIAKAGNLICSEHGGKWVYTDTDSTYVTFPFLKTSQEIWDYAIDVAKKVSSEFPGLTIEFEQAIYTKFIILSKKKYMYYSCDREGNCDGKIGKRGVVLARRDNAKLVRIAYSHIVDMIFTGRTTEEIEQYLIEYISDLFRKRVPYSDYVATKSIGSVDDNDDDDNDRLGDYKVKRLPDDEFERDKALNGRTERQWYIDSCPPQVQLAERMRLRGFPVDVGSRIEYVVIEKSSSKKLGKRMEEYEYFMKRRSVFRIDNLYYLKSMINPIDQLLNVVGISKFIESQYTYRSKFADVQKELMNRVCTSRCCCID